ncbi:MAG TPA: HEAT repeat domain-containing protein [Tepidisphaeraceae bacterium]|nr:HEAT repeat domain-containing protein [Tepidisphaeraceae bacterium]
MTRRTVILLLSLAILPASVLLPLVGCGGRGNRDLTRDFPPPKPPPPVPPRKEMPLDPALVEAARKELAAAAADKDETRRANALEVMRLSPDEGSRKAILEALGDREPVVRFAAAMAAGELRLAEAKPRLAELVDDAVTNVRVAAIFALHRQGDMSRSHELEQTAQDPDPSVRGNTALVLGLLGEKSAMNGPRSILHVLRKDPHAAVRQQAYEAMWRLGDRSVVDELVGLTVSRYADDQMMGLLALVGPKSPSVADHVRTGLTSDHFEVSLVAARAMGMLGSDEGYGVALKGARSNDARHRFLAAFAFGAIGRSDAQPLLATLIKDRDPRVRIAAAGAVLQLAAQA